MSLSHFRSKQGAQDHLPLFLYGHKNEGFLNYSILHRNIFFLLPKKEVIEWHISKRSLQLFKIFWQITLLCLVYKKFKILWLWLVWTCNVDWSHMYSIVSIQQQIFTSYISCFAPLNWQKISEEKNEIKIDRDYFASPLNTKVSWVFAPKNDGMEKDSVHSIDW